MVDEDSYDLDEEPVVVRRAAYDEGKRLQERVTADGQGMHVAFDRARDKAADCRAEGDAVAAGFWMEVFHFLMHRECVGGDVPTVILEEGEEWDAEEGEVRKSGNRRRRTGTG